MKKIIIIICCLFASISQADFRDAQINYEQGNFEDSFKEFLTLAKFGNIKSQHNVAVMYANGQGVKQNLIHAFAWSKISDYSKDYKNLSNQIEKQLSTNEKQLANELLVDFQKSYAYENSKVLLGPVTNLSPNEKKDRLLIKAIKKIPPKYPRKMLMNNIKGWVDLTFNIYPDGSVRDMQVIAESPIGAFTNETMLTVEKYKYGFYRKGKEVEIFEPIVGSMRMTFQIAASTNRFTLKQKAYLKKLIKNATNGDINAQYSYAILYDTFLQREGEIEAEQINQWLFNAAQDGIIDAQYRVGKNIYYGKDCKVEKQKGLDWIMKAAESGNADAEFMAYQMLQSSKIINQSNQPPFYWLQQAAENGSTIAQLRYTIELTKFAHLTDNQIKTAKGYLKNYAKNYYKTIQWYQAKALILDKSNNHSKALRNINTAIKRAQQKDWDITELIEQRTMIESHKT